MAEEVKEKEDDKRFNDIEGAELLDLKIGRITQYTENKPNPSQTRNFSWICFTRVNEDLTDPGEDEIELGKWLIFRNFDEFDEIWEKIVIAITQKKLNDCYQAYCSTICYDPTSSGPGPRVAGVMCVYTAVQDMMDIGFKLIEIVEQDIKYKTDKATHNYEFIHTGLHQRTTIKTIFWNNGSPSLECLEGPCNPTRRNIEDIWHINVVDGPEPMCDEEDYGRWILYLEYKELTLLWHFLKAQIKSKESDFGAIKMVCPAKHNLRSATERPVFHIYTTKMRKDSVGRKLIKMVKANIDYEYKSSNMSSQDVRIDTLYWNKGEPDYERVTRRGITMNWRTGEQL